MGQCNKMLEEMSFNALFQKLPVGIEVYDERGQLVDLNRTDENLFAISRKDIMGINLFENPNFPEDKIARVKQGEMVVFDCNYEFDNIQTNEYYNIDPKKEGTNLRLSIKCVPLKGEAEDICGYVLMFTDETAMQDKLRWVERERQRKEYELAKAKEANRLKSIFLANMSHEIRTPLNAIVGFANILAETKEIEEEEREFYVDIIDKNSELLLQLIEDILDFSKIEAGTFDITKRNFDFKEICEETYAVHALKIPKNVRFVFDRGSQPVTVFSDPKRVVQVISNFLTNAIKFTSEGEIKLAYKVSKDEIRVSVSDTGMGISEEDCRTIFDRFVKLNACKQGTGLGLAICKNIIENLGGRIGVESTLGVGSTFWFTLPLKEIKENEPKF